MVLVSWSDAFRDWLVQSRRKPRYTIENVLGQGFDPIGGSLLLSSHDEGKYYNQVIAAHGHRFSAGAVQPGEWSVTVAEASIALTGGPFPDAKGQLVQVKVGTFGWATNEYQPILTGRVQGYTRSGDGTWFIVVRSVLASLVARNTQTSGEQSLFYALDDLINDTTVATAYTAGDANVKVVQTLSGESETGGSYLLEITPDTGEPFLATSTGKFVGPIRYGGLSAGLLGTTDASASIGNAVRPLAMIEGHPIDIVRKLVVSTGGLTSLPYDTLPASWSIGLPDDVFDHSEADAVKSLGAATSSYEWMVYSADPVDDGLSWISGWLAPAGYFLCDHHGQVTVRMATDPSQLAVEVEFAYIVDRDIVSIDTYDAWDPGQVAEYGRHRLVTHDGAINADGAIESLPARWRKILELPFIDTNTSTWRTEISDRVSGWYTRAGERVEVTLAGWKFAHLGPGSSVAMDTTKLPQRIPYGVWMVLSCDPDWFGATTRLVMARIFEEEG